MKNFLKIAEGVDVLPLLMELHRQPHLWNRNDVRLSKAGPHWQSDDIWLRYKDESENKQSGDYRNFSDPHDGVWYPAYYALPSARKLIFSLMARVEGERIGGIFIYRVAPGKEILPHIDSGWHVDFYDKFNVCLQSNPRAAFVYEDEAMVQRPGDVHRFVNTEKHSVVNSGEEDHIVMTVCIRVHDYAARFQGEDGVSEAQKINEKLGLVAGQSEELCLQRG